MQILNRTNNIFELVTVEPMISDKPPAESRGRELVLNTEIDTSEERKLKLKGEVLVYLPSIFRFNNNLLSVF